MAERFNLFLKFWMPVYIYAALIYIFSSIPLTKPLGPTNIDKVLHLLEYAIFSFLLARAFESSKRDYFKVNFFMLAIGSAVFYGLTDEIHQAFIPSREMSGLDFFFDSLGAILGSFYFLKRKD